MAYNWQLAAQNAISVIVIIGLFAFIFYNMHENKFKKMMRKIFTGGSDE